MPFPPDPNAALPVEPGLEIDLDRPIVFLADASSTLERRLVAGWIRRAAPGATFDIIDLAPSRRRRRWRRTDPALAARLNRGDDPLVVPVRVVWFPSVHDGRRSASWSDVLKLGDPRDPNPVRQWLILGAFPHRVGIVVGTPAGAGELLGAHAESVEVLSLVDFVTRRAHLALERAERSVRGNRYKVPKFLHEEILGRAEFRDGVMRVASERGLPVELALARSRYYLREIAASHSPFLIDLIANAIHWVYRQGYGAIIYDPERIGEITALGSENPVAFVPSHRSNLDRLSLQYLLWENDLPPNHTAAGINMNFFPVGPLIRRTGAFFIRRSFKDNPLYKFVLRSYLDFLVEKRFPLEWYMEGGRSRSGKLLPPKLGMLGWVVDSVRRGKADDLFLIPTSIAYDQIQDVGDYASEASGAEKQKESFSWAFSAIRSLRRRYGNIHVRFADPISVAKEIDLDSEATIDLQKLAFEVMYRISQITPITPTAVVSIALLASRGRAQTAAEISHTASSIDRYVESHRLPTTEVLTLEDPREVVRILRQLADHGSVTVFAEGPDTVYRLDHQQALQAAYYRNTIVHYFVPGAIAELALLAAGDDDPVGDFWAEVGRLRDLLKFEFFFPEREEFRRHVETEVGEDGWEDELAIGGSSAAARILAAMSPHRAHWALLPFLESYQVVADQLVASTRDIEERPFLSACLDRGRQYRLEGRVQADESVSKVLLGSALGLARNRGLVDGDGDPTEARRAFAAEISDVTARGATVAELADEKAKARP